VNAIKRKDTKPPTAALIEKNKLKARCAWLEWNISIDTRSVDVQLYSSCSNTMCERSNVFDDGRTASIN